MKHLLISRLVILFFILIGCLTCKNMSESSPPEYDPNLCSEYSCPLHKDKMSVSLDVCPECGIQMVDADLMKSLLSRTVQSINDSIGFYNKRILNESFLLFKSDSISKKEVINSTLYIIENLEKAKLAHQNLDKLVFGKHRVVLKPYNLKIDKLYAVATYRVSAINKELDKPDFEKSNIKLLTEKLIETMYEIDKEQVVIRFKTNNK